MSDENFMKLKEHLEMAMNPDMLVILWAEQQADLFGLPKPDVFTRVKIQEGAPYGDYIPNGMHCAPDNKDSKHLLIIRAEGACVYELAETIQHELGHMFKNHFTGKLFSKEETESIFGDAGTHEERRDSTYLFNLQKTSDLEHWDIRGFVSPYASVNPEEDFAETFAEVCMSLTCGEKIMRDSYVTPELKKKVGWMYSKIKKAIDLKVG